MNRKNPFVGPRAIETGEKLFGRERETSQLVNLLVAERIVLLYSPSGAGKTSLIQAALLPNMKARRFMVLPIVRVNLDPDPALAETPGFNRYIFSALSSLEEGLPSEERLPAADLAAMRLSAYLERRDHPALTLIFDQFEEILLLDPTDQDTKSEFFAQVGDALGKRSHWALFAMREDYLAGLDPYALAVPTRFANTFRLDLLDKTAACQVVQRTAAQEEVEFTDQAAQKLTDDLSLVQVQSLDGSVVPQQGQYIEPVQLQVVSRHIWERLEPGATQITAAAIEEVGNVDQSLAAYYADQVSTIARDCGFPERGIREWFEHELITESGLRGQVLMGSEQSQGMENQVILRLENAHLVRAEKRRGLTWFELSHDRLVKPVSVDNADWFQANLSLLQRQAGLWAREGHPEHLLLRGHTLKKAESWVESYSDQMTPVETAFWEACLEERQREQDTRQREEQAIKLTEQERSAKRLRAMLAFALIAALAATVFAVWAVFSQIQASLAAGENADLAATNATIAAENQFIANTAQSASTQAVQQQETAQVASTQALEQQATAEYNADMAAENEQLAAEQARIAAEQASIAASRQLAAQAGGYLDTQPDLSALLSIESYRAWQTWEARGMLLTVLQHSLEHMIEPLWASVEKNPIISIALSPDGEHMAWGDEKGNLVIYNYQTNKRNNLQGHKGWVNGLIFSPDGKRLISCDWDGNLFIWDIASGDSNKIRDVVSSCQSLSLSPDGSQLAAAVGTQISIWDLNSGKLVRNLRHHTDEVTAVAWSPDGQYIASGSNDERALLWKPDSNAPSKVIWRDSNVTSLAWSPDSSILAMSSEDGTLMLWDVVRDVSAGEEVKTHEGKAIRSISFSHDGALIASGGDDDLVRLTDPNTMQEVGQLDGFHEGPVNSVSFIPRGGELLLASGGSAGMVGLYLVETQQPLNEVVVTDMGQVLALRDIKERRLLLASGQPLKGIQVWEIIGDEGGQLFSLDVSYHSAAFSPDGETLAVGQEEGLIKFYDVVTSEPLRSMKSDSGPALSLAFSDSGKLLASSHCPESPVMYKVDFCEDNTIWLWDPVTMEPLQKLVSGATMVVGASTFTHSDSILSLAFPPDEEVLSSGSQDTTILQWDLYTGLTIGLPWERHLGAVTSLAYSPDGIMAASGGTDHMLVLWDVEGGGPLNGPLSGVSDSLLSLAFSPDGDWLLSGSADGEVLAWDVNPDSWVERACYLAGRNMTEVEWKQFLPDQPYRQTCEMWPEGGG